MVKKTVLVTGGAGFIGSAVIRHILDSTNYRVINIDKLTYAGNLENLKAYSLNKNYHFVKCDISNKKDISEVFEIHEPDIIMHLAAESHVDRSINNPLDFINTNIVGTYILLEESRKYIQKSKKDFKFHHISTDEVFGDLEDGDFFDEETPYNPSSPYSASKASSDHLVRSWHRTFQLPIVITNCSNNYGPFHFPEKLIPRMIINAINGRNLPVYGDGSQIRDWLYVDDHARALFLVAEHGNIGETYAIGGNNEVTNLDVVKKICNILDDLHPSQVNDVKSYSDLITFVKDRPGHDTRYAINSSKIMKDLSWKPLESFETGIVKTINWYLNNEDWWKKLLSNNRF